MNTKYDILSWDSDFFGYKVGQIDDLEFDENKLDEILCLLNREQVRLVYYSSKVELKGAEIISNHYTGKFVGKKITYIKKPQRNLLSSDLIFSYKANYPEDKLIKLAIESGVYSRFNIDDQVGTQKFEDLYKLWIVNSVNKEIAREVLVCRHNNDIVGFVTLEEKNLRANIGIIAVDSDYRGKGIGKSLMYAAEKWTKDHFLNDIQVVTQYENRSACRLYERCGYIADKIEYFYHFWKKNNT